MHKMSKFLLQINLKNERKKQKKLFLCVGENIIAIGRTNLKVT